MESIELDNNEQFNYWLIHNLEPISEADPIVLAKYVIALIKKDKPEKALRQICLKQLEYFLESETTPFVDKLFDAIKTKAYLNVSKPKCLEDSEKAGGDVGSSDLPQESTDKLSDTNPESDIKGESENSNISTSRELAEVATDYIDSANQHHTANADSGPTDTIEYSLVSSSSSNSIHASLATSSAESSKAIDKTSTSNASPIVSCTAASVSQSANERISEVQSAITTSNTSKPRSSSNRDHRPRPYSRHRSRSRSHSSQYSSCSESGSLSGDSRSDRTNSDYNDESRSASKSPAGSDARRHSRYSSRRSNHDSSSRSRYDNNLRSNRFAHDSQYRSQYRSTRRHESPVNRSRSSRPIRSHNRPNDSRTYQSHHYSRHSSRDHQDSSKHFGSSRKSKNDSSYVDSTITSHELYQPSKIGIEPNADSIGVAASTDVKTIKSEIEDSTLPEKSESTEKSPYCLYPVDETKPNEKLLVNNPYFIEPYNPESSTLDPHLVMQLMPNFLLNNSRFGLNSNTPHNESNNATVSDSANNGGGGGGNFGKMNNYGSGMRRRELVGVSIDGTDSYDDQNVSYKPTPRGNRWPHHYNRNPSSKRENNIDILASATNPSGSSGNKRYNSNIAIDLEESKYQASKPQETITDNPEPQDKDAPPVETFSEDGGKQAIDKTMLVIRKIPPRLNTIGSLNKHFSRFGTVVKINVCYENDPESALIQFSNRFEATAAIRSTDAVLNNRFIKVYWPKSVQSQNYRPTQKRKPEFEMKNSKRLVMDGGGFVTKHAANNHPFYDANMYSRKPPRSFKRTISNPADDEGGNEDKLKIIKAEGETAAPAPKPEPMRHGISHVERSKQMKALKTQHQVLNESLANQRHLMKKAENAKSSKEKAAILKLLQLTMKNIDETKKSIEAIQAVVKPTLRTTKINNVSTRKEVDLGTEE